MTQSPRRLTATEVTSSRLTPTNSTKPATQCTCGMSVKKAGSNYVHVMADGSYIYINHRVSLTPPTPETK